MQAALPPPAQSKPGGCCPGGTSWEQECLHRDARIEGVLEMRDGCTHLLRACLFSAGVCSDPGVGQQKVQWWPLAALPRAPTPAFFMQKYISSQ